MLVGLPGILLAIGFAITAREPPREEDPRSNDDQEGFRQYFGTHWPVLVSLYAGTCMLGTTSLSINSWMPSLLIRVHHVSAVDAALLYGSLGATAAVLGNATWSWLANRAERQDAGGAIRVLRLASLIGLPCAFIGPLIPDVRGLLAVIVIAQFCTSCMFALLMLMLQLHFSSRYRGRLVALNQISLNLIGFMLGPLLVPLFASLWPNSAESLGRGMAMTGLLGMCGAAFAYHMAGKLFVKSRAASGGSGRNPG
jgi:MFS family permease